MAYFGDCCESCGSTENLTLDHDHNCCKTRATDRYWKTCGKCLRGILCRPCNMALGALQDDAERLRRLADYVEGYNGSR